VVVLLNWYREIGRTIIKKTTFVLASTDVGGGIRVVRIASYFMYFLFQVTMAVMFRLETANFDSQALTTVVVVLQAVLEVFMRCTAEERDKFSGNLAGRALACCGIARGSRRGRSLVIEASGKRSAIAPAPVLATSGPGESLQVASSAASSARRGKTMAVREERFADEQERAKVIKNFAAVCILADMVAEYAGKLTARAGRSLAARFPF
jgi:hypothetical protein